MVELPDCAISNAPIITNIKIIGNNTKNHDKLVYPALQNVFNNHVQNTMYNNLPKNTVIVSGTWHWYNPTQ